MTATNSSTDSSDNGKPPDETLQDMLRVSRQRQAEVSALLGGSRAVLQYREFQDAARAIFDSCKTLIGATSGYVALLSEDGAENAVLFLDSGGLPCTVDPSLPMPIRGLREESYRTGKAVFENDFFQSRWIEFLPEGHARLDNVLFAPLVIGRKVVGLLGIANKPEGFTDHDARMAAAFGELAAIALQNSRTLEALESSEQRFRSLTQSASDGIISTDHHGAVVYWNEAAEKMFGYAADEMTGRPLASVIPARFREDHQRGMRRVASTDRSTIIGKTVDVVGLRAGGVEFPIELSLSTWKNKEGTFFTGILRDVTEQKRVREAMRESEELHRITLGSISDAVFITDDSGNFAFVCPNVHVLFGYSHDETVAKGNIRSLLGEDLFDFSDLERLGELRNIARVVRDKAGRDHVVLVTVKRVSIKGGTVLYTCRDITERKRAEEQVGLLAAFPSENPDAVMRVSHDGTLIYANEASRDLLDLWNLEIGQLLPDPLSTTVSSVFASDRRADIEVECGSRTIVIRIVPVVEAGYVNFYGRDVTERKRARLFLEIANRHMQMQPLLAEFVAEIKGFTGCAAAGIRILDEDGRIPYQASDGFHRRFRELESPLSIETDRCLCVNVVKGETDDRLPCYTKGGSFSVGGTTRFLATMSEEEIGETRNACNEFGYESTALVPIRLGSRILGLIHLADARENAIPREVVDSLERIGMQLGTAVQRVRAEEALRAANEALETRVKRRTTELEETNRELKAEIAQRERLEREVLEIGTREQRRIGQELHDGLGQELTGLSYLATSLHRKLRAGVSSEAETAAELAEGIPRVLGQVQSIVKGLVPLELGAEDLEPALQVLAVSTEERTGVSCSLESDGAAKVHDGNVAVQLYRIAQEAVTNAVKHGRARHIVVTLKADRSRIVLQISDDGVGIPPEAARGSGSGLHIMQYRARVIGGTLNINPGAGGGTLVTCSLPREERDELSR